ncbi:hypothetical protein CY34DRAFT_791342 [Suillus luteus UH-Slu-Lm8-n1]|uniref:Uncharacterized protein n=1 Tax=Suillus luteus UH-Slu-Lm8-n1 TaxID=930992 RepID=A0A0D0BAN6_9AGAM|nr:hypothetical protein CY34DRAFT_791342 [Suillus luteus UH-Slu-Lm8-n1]
MMRKWNCNTGLLVGESWKGKGEVYALVLSPDGKTIGVTWSLSWSPGRDHIVSESSNEMIFIQKAETAYSPSGDRIASGGYNNTICIWDSKTRELVVGPIDYKLGSGLGRSCHQ